MRKAWVLALGILLACPLAIAAQEQKPKQESVAEAARKAREQKKTAKPATKVFTNDNIPKAPVVEKAAGEGTPEAQGATGQAQATGDETAAASRDAEEAAWRKRFAEARGKLATAEKELDILQRELGKLSVQYYDDPQKALKEQTQRTDINQHRTKIEQKQKQIEELRQALSALEDELRAAGGPPGWSRP